MPAQPTRRDLLLAPLALLLGPSPAQAKVTPDTLSGMRWWLSSADLRHRLTEQPILPWSPAAAGALTVTVDASETFQTLLGLGSSLEPATCWNLSRMSPEDRERTIVPERSS